jgi:hypothetical protein
MRSNSDISTDCNGDNHAYAENGHVGGSWDHGAAAEFMVVAIGFLDLIGRGMDGGCMR